MAELKYSSREWIGILLPYTPRKRHSVLSKFATELLIGFQHLLDSLEQAEKQISVFEGTKSIKEISNLDHTVFVLTSVFCVFILLPHINMSKWHYCSDI